MPCRFDTDKRVFICDEIEIDSNIYPIIWLGEKKISISRFGSIGRFYRKDDVEDTMRYFIIPIAMFKLELNFKEAAYIVAGGVEPQVWWVDNIGFGKRSAIETIAKFLSKSYPYNDREVLLPHGLGSSSYFIIGRKIDVEFKTLKPDDIDTDEWERFRMFIAEYPYKYIVVIEDGKFILRPVGDPCW